MGHDGSSSAGAGRPGRASGGRAVALSLVLALVGMAVLTVVLALAGLMAVRDALAAAGWGLVAVAAFHALPMAADTASWARLIGRQHRLPFRRLLAMRWICESVNTLLPAAQVGGDVVRARLASLSGVPGPVAAASVIVDLTLGILALGAFAVLGIGVLVLLPGDGSVPVVLPALVAAVLSVAFVAVVYRIQRAGPFGPLVRLAARLVRGRAWFRLARRAKELDRALDALYDRRRDVAASVGWTFGAYVIGVGEVWLAFYFLGHPITIMEALVVESVIQIVRNVLFPVPGALGFQEGGAVLVGALLGIPPHTALALSLVKRVRELLWGLPGLVAWQWLEGRRFWKRPLRLS